MILKLILFLLRLPPILGALALHEYAHGWMAKRYGDNTAEMEGRLTVNPLKHLDPLGTIMLFLGPIGWAKPVPVNPMNLRDPIRDMMPIAAAGPGMNLILALVSAGFVKAGILVMGNNPQDPSIAMYLYFILWYISLRINVGLAIFNLIPLHPLDGSRILMGILPRDKAMAMMRYGNVFTIIFFVLVLTGNLGFIIGPINWIQRQITTAFAIPFDLSTLVQP